jgi:signal peptidase
MSRHARLATVVPRILDGLLGAITVVVLIGIVLGPAVTLAGGRTLIISGGSMEPTIGLGSAVVIQPVAATAIRPNDIVSLKSGPQLSTFTHRVTRVTERAGTVWLETKGDANGTIDPSLTPSSAVIGRVILSVPFAGYLLRLIGMPSGQVLLLSLSFGLLLLGRLIRAPTTEIASAGSESADRAARPIVDGASA